MTCSYQAWKKTDMCSPNLEGTYMNDTNNKGLSTVMLFSSEEKLRNRLHIWIDTWRPSSLWRRESKVKALRTYYN